MIEDDETEQQVCVYSTNSLVYSCVFDVGACLCVFVCV